MTELLKVLAFSLGLILLFTGVTYMAPQVVGEAPPAETVELVVGDLDELAARGEALFRGKGACTLCHNDMGRAPDLLKMDVVASSGKRLVDPRYRGTAIDAESYLRESMVEPDAFVVKGFGVKGSGDSRSPMPIATRPPASLSLAEVDAIIAYLQVKDGHPVTVTLPGSEVSSEVPPSPPVTGEPAGAAALAVRLGCPACHTLPGSESPIGPSLLDVGNRLDGEAIRRAILDPDAELAAGYPAGMMPRDYGERMTVAELGRLLVWLQGLKGERP